MNIQDLLIPSLNETYYHNTGLVVRTPARFNTAQHGQEAVYAASASDEAPRHDSARQDGEDTVTEDEDEDERVGEHSSGDERAMQILATVCAARLAEEEAVSARERESGERGRGKRTKRMTEKARAAVEEGESRSQERVAAGAAAAVRVGRAKTRVNGPVRRSARWAERNGGMAGMEK
ncbi:hypothetical protein P153DRAFT_387996 [Dothidotthia symphoricarpi CBS 119687]|uniref:Uncharacterized protein n=1 Tax=Dothidotthia symphoricarpi CBS 119687 TaxID=1392245 RepID=A0A6A6A8C5_9PLEO|nr:uncharacterized protein P153DRAFT_387996 [Dothidotthia symphoricarpi CBS 119687]KAF2127455.1 hypothetical protein P153DRAFT_387996 [Dothidotthia symphoricarpi CBS 119687]